MKNKAITIVAVLVAGFIALKLLGFAMGLFSMVLPLAIVLGLGYLAGRLHAASIAEGKTVKRAKGSAGSIGGFSTGAIEPQLTTELDRLMADMDKTSTGTNK